MEVFVIPLGRERYELYCEHPVELVQSSDEGEQSFVGRMLQKLSVWLRDTEERHQSGTTAEPKGLIGRWRERGLGWMVERIAEQRLLWNLRGQLTATAAHPQDMTFEQVMDLIRRELSGDYDRHRRWLMIDGAMLLFTGIVLGPLFFLIPGVANLPAAYFAFRTVGHWLSMRGAQQGLHNVTWHSRPCPPLGELRDLASLDPDTRDERVQDIGERLHLQHLSTFFERMAARPA
jgi:hypothetical protein